MGLDVVFENFLDFFFFFFYFQFFSRVVIRNFCYRIEGGFFFFLIKIYLNMGFFLGKIWPWFLFFIRNFFFLGVIRNFFFRIESGGLKKKKIERGVLLGKIWTWFLFFIWNFLFLFLWELSETFVIELKVVFFFNF